MAGLRTKTILEEGANYDYPPEDRELEEEINEWFRKNPYDDEGDGLPEHLKWYLKDQNTRRYFSDDEIAAMKQEDTGQIK